MRIMRQSLKQTRYISERLTKHRQFEVNTFVVESVQDFKQCLGILVMFPRVAHSTNITRLCTQYKYLDYADKFNTKSNTSSHS